MNADRQDLVDRSEITDLVYRLGACLDESRFDELGSLFTDDAMVLTPGGVATGRDAVVAQARRNHRLEDTFQHVTSNLLIQVDGDRGRVRGNLVVTVALPVETAQPTVAPQPSYTVGEIYRIDVVRTADRWRFARVETVPVWLSGVIDRDRLAPTHS